MTAFNIKSKCSEFSHIKKVSTSIEGNFGQG